MDAPNREQESTEASCEASLCPGPDEVERRLQELIHTSSEPLREILRRGHLAGDFTHKGHSRTYPGLKVYHETNGELRSYFATRGWALTEEENIPRAVRPDGLVVLTAVSGNEHTGLRGRGMQTRRPRGEAGLRLVQQNRQLALVDLLPEDDPERVGIVGQPPKTWFLLYHRAGDVIRSELSLADAVTEEGSLLVWHERLLLPEFNLHDGDGNPLMGPAPSPTPDVDVPVTRRTA